CAVCGVVCCVCRAAAITESCWLQCTFGSTLGSESTAIVAGRGGVAPPRIVAANGGAAKWCACRFLESEVQLYRIKQRNKKTKNNNYYCYFEIKRKPAPSRAARKCTNSRVGAWELAPTEKERSANGRRGSTVPSPRAELVRTHHRTTTFFG